MDGSPVSVLEQPLARRSDAGQPEVDSRLTSVVRVVLQRLGEQKRPWHPKSEEWHLFVERCRVKRTHATDTAWKQDAGTVRQSSGIPLLDGS
jgi:hypothetical protein